MLFSDIFSIFNASFNDVQQQANTNTGFWTGNWPQQSWVAQMEQQQHQPD